MVKVQIGKKKCKLPQSFAEIKPYMVLRLAPFIYKSKPDRILALSLLTQVDISILDKVNEEDLYLLVKIIDFLFKPDSQRPFKAFQYKGTEYLLPESNFNDVCMIELAMSHIFFNLFITTNNSQYLDRMIGELCRPEKKEAEIKDLKWDGSHRQLYNGKVSELNGLLFSELNEETKVCILNFYVGASIAFRNRYGEVFDPPEEEETTQTKASYNWKDDTFLLLINSLSKSGQYGNYDSTCLTNIHTVFLNLVQDKKHRPKTANQNDI